MENGVRDGKMGLGFKTHTSYSILLTSSLAYFLTHEGFHQVDHVLYERSFAPRDVFE